VISGRSTQSSTQSRPRARALAELPIDAVLARADELARRWLIALIRARPLDEAVDVPIHDLALEGPALCAQMVRAVQSDMELSRLTERAGASPGEGSVPVRRISAIAGARDAPATVAAVEDLRGVLWEVLLDQLQEPTAREVGDLADRLAHVCAVALAVAVAVPGPGTPDVPMSIHDAAPAPPLAGTGARDRATARASQRQAIVVDELARSRMDEHQPSAAAPRVRAGGIEIRDVRGTDGPAAWISSISSQLERFERDRLLFAVLLVEVIGIERLSPGGRAESHAGMIDDVERALASAHGARGSLTRERPGRYWLVMPDTDRAGARQLAERLTRAVAAFASDRLVPLEVAVGTAVCPDDGHQAATLAAHADVGLYADRSAVRAAGGRRSTVEGSV
jgi:hypothetical protein